MMILSVEADQFDVFVELEKRASEDNVLVSSYVSLLWAIIQQ